MRRRIPIAIASTSPGLRRVFRGSYGWTAERGAERANAYESAGLTLEQFESGRYTRLVKLKELRDANLLDSDLRWISRTPR